METKHPKPENKNFFHSIFPNKKGVLKGFFFENWPEILTIALFFLGAFIALVLGSAIISYFTVFIAGLVTGKLWWDHKKNYKLGLFLMIAGFFLGFLIGAVYGKKIIIVISFMLGTFIGYYLLEKGLAKW